MISFDTHICRDKNFYEITYFTDNYANYKYMQNIIREQMDKENNNEFVCGIDNDICLKERCTRSFKEKGCMYLKGVYKKC